MTDLRAAIDLYHSLLDDEMARASNELLEEQQQTRGLFFGTRPLCTVLRPRFLTGEDYKFLQDAIKTIMPVFAKTHRAAMADADIRKQFLMEPWEEQLLQIPQGFRASSPTARMDSFFVPETNELKFTEYNAETPAGISYNDALSDIMFALPVMRKFERRYEARALPGRHHVLHALNESYRQWGGRDRIKIGILDWWREVPTYSEFVQFKKYFNEQGYDCMIGDPRECEYKDGALWARDAEGVAHHINVIYKRVLITELVTGAGKIPGMGINNPIINAIKDHAVCMVNPFHCKVLHRKTSFAVISDEANSELFTAAELRAINQFIPWTRIVAQRFTQLDGNRVDLMPYLAANKDNYVLKPADEYGGKGIILGWTVDDAAWQTGLKDALTTPTIVQRRVTVPTEAFPSYVDNRVQVIDRFLDTNPYVWYGEYMSSCLTRLSTAALLNVTAGGGSTVPTFVIDER